MINNTVIKDNFWNNYKDLVTEKMIPYQWNVLNDNLDIKIEKERNDELIPSEKSHAIENFKIAAGIKKGRHYGYIFQDSDLYKWLEAVSYSIEYRKDNNLKNKAIEMFDLISNAQMDNGYINTYFQIEEPENIYRNLAQSHELYCYGHLIEAIVAFYKATNNTNPLKISEKIVNHLYETFGHSNNQIKGYDGHEEIERALIKLYKITEDQKCIKLAKFFIFERGTEPNFFIEQKKDYNGPSYHGMEKFPLTYFQAHKPVIEQEEAVGHAVRQVYLSSATAELAKIIGNEGLKKYSNSIWNNIINKKMYVTGGIGSTVEGEAFTAEYDLPNDTMYCETCASVGLIFFANNMFKIYEDSEYINVLEKVLYNGLLSGVSLDGQHFFYVNPLEVDQKDISKDPLKSHVKTQRADWFGCACCPPNLARLILSLEKYIYHLNENNEMYVNLFIESEYNFEGAKFIQKINDKDDGKIIEFNFEGHFNKEVYIRIPKWVTKFKVKINDKLVESTKDKGYVNIGKGWDEKDNIQIIFEYGPKFIYSNPLIKENRNKVSLQYGPFIYCIENVKNDSYLWLNEINTKEKIQPITDADFPFVKCFKVKSQKIDETTLKNNLLYTEDETIKYIEKELNFIPYFCWGNRNSTEMKVWINKQC